MQDEAPRIWPDPWPKDRLPELDCAGLSLGVVTLRRLLQVRDHQMAEHLAGRPPIMCGIFYEREVVLLQVFMGRASFLDVDGQIWYENFGEGLEPKVLRDARDIASDIVRWSGAIGLQELIDALPSRPETAVVCVVCEGSRWFPASMMVSLDGQQLHCLRCYGLGWTFA